MKSIRLRPAEPADAALLHAWDREPHVIKAVTDDPTAEEAFIDADWEQEISDQSPVSYFLIGEENGRPVERRLFGPDDCLVHRLERAQWEARS